ncbi:MAG: cytochrome c-type biogenesis protein CcmH [Proteobacteria bacterium]|nr:cytochrome c-type biogenesis protein CcmH [Pseudomonadota bacterium]
MRSCRFVAVLTSLLLLLLLSAASVVAAPRVAPPLVAAAPTPASEAQLDARAHALAQQLRCVVCQNQTLADSNADLAVDLRRQIRQQLAGGADEQAVKDWLAQRYGDFVLYKPPLKPLTWLLWFGPLVLLLIVIATLLRMRRRDAGAVEQPVLKADERQRLDAMLQADGKEPAP